MIPHATESVSLSGTSDASAGLDASSARLCLVAAAALWATYPVAICLLSKLMAPVAPPDTALVTAIRFLIMAIFSVPLLLESAAGVSSPGFLAAVSQLGVLGSVGTLLNTWGLEQTGAVRGALLLSSVNVFTPLLAALFGRTPEEREVRPVIWLSCLVALVGTVVATAGDGSHPFAVDLSLGDLAVLAASLGYAGVKVTMGSVARFHQAGALAGGRLLVSALLACAALLWDYSGHPEAALYAALQLPAPVWGVLTASALASGVLATILQAKGQSVVAAAEAQPIFALVVLFSVSYEALFFGEAVEAREWAGGLCLVLSAVLATSYKPATEKDAVLEGSAR